MSNERFYEGMDENPYEDLFDEMNAEVGDIEVHRAGCSVTHHCVQCENDLIMDLIADLTRRIEELEAKSESEGHQDRHSRSSDEGDAGSPIP